MQNHLVQVVVVLLFHSVSDTWRTSINLHYEDRQATDERKLADCWSQAPSGNISLQRLIMRGGLSSQRKQKMRSTLRQSNLIPLATPGKSLLLQRPVEYIHVIRSKDGKLMPFERAEDLPFFASRKKWWNLDAPVSIARKIKRSKKKRWILPIFTTSIERVHFEDRW